MGAKIAWCECRISITHGHNSRIFLFLSYEVSEESKKHILFLSMYRRRSVEGDESEVTAAGGAAEGGAENASVRVYFRRGDAVREDLELVKKREGEENGNSIVVAPQGTMRGGDEMEEVTTDERGGRLAPAVLLKGAKVYKIVL